MTGKQLFLLCTGVVPLLLVAAAAQDPKAAPGFKRYPIQSGTILYDINTTGESAGLKTQTQGVARLVFDHWGAREVKEDDATDVQTGDFNETRNRRSLSKIDFGTVYSVDYDENVTYKTRNRDMDVAIAEGKDLSGENFAFLKEIHAVKVGTETIVGLRCDLWKGADQEVCLYQGIPLRISISTDGFRSSRTAVYAVLNKPVNENEFSLPAFPIVIDDDYTDNASALTRTEDYIAAVGDLNLAFKKMAISPTDTNRTLTPHEEKKVINILGKRYLEKQKRLLPRLKIALTDARQCIADANSSTAAKACIDPVNAIDEQLGDKTENFVYAHWNDRKRQAILKSLDSESTYLNVTLKCVQEHNQTTDVITCTEGSLDAGE